MYEAIRKIKTMDDIRVEKARLRYEALIAEKNLNESLGAFEKLSDFLSNIKRGYSAFQQAYHMFSRMNSWLARVFSGFKKKETPDTQEEPVSF